MMRVLGKRQRETVDRLRGIRNANEIVAERTTRWNRVASTIGTAAASQAFVMANAIALGGWIVLNYTMHKNAIDPFPFPFLSFCFTSEAIFLSLFILVSQTQQSKKDRIRTEIEYQVALKMQLEIMQLHQKLDRLQKATEQSGVESTASPASTTAAPPR